ncbi:MAG: hypothetical protein Q8R04_06980 [Nanoarchaeota archaeon]|nr:hypothetical protein [Nanoarchaeota archaeon]
MKFKKKGVDVHPLAIVGAMLLVGFGVWISINMLTTGVVFGSETISPFQMSAKNSQCDIISRELTEKGALKEPIEGEKGDGYSDDCDICLGGDNRKVSNSYKVPDECYVPTDGKKIRTYKDMCKARGGCYISNKGQCCLLGTRCGPECK